MGFGSGIGTGMEMGIALSGRNWSGATNANIICKWGDVTVVHYFPLIPRNRLIFNRLKGTHFAINQFKGLFPLFFAVAREGVGLPSNSRKSVNFPPRPCPFSVQSNIGNSLALSGPKIHTHQPIPWSACPSFATFPSLRGSKVSFVRSFVRSFPPPPTCRTFATLLLFLTLWPIRTLRLPEKSATTSSSILYQRLLFRVLIGPHPLLHTNNRRYTAEEGSAFIECEWVHDMNL